MHFVASNRLYSTGASASGGVGGGNLFENLMAMQGTMEVLSTVYVVDARSSRRLDISVHDGTIRGSEEATSFGQGDGARNFGGARIDFKCGHFVASRGRAKCRLGTRVWNGLAGCWSFY